MLLCNASQFIFQHHSRESRVTRRCACRFRPAATIFSGHRLSCKVKPRCWFIQEAAEGRTKSGDEPGSFGSGLGDSSVPSTDEESFTPHPAPLNHWVLWLATEFPAVCARIGGISLCAKKTKTKKTLRRLLRLFDCACLSVRCVGGPGLCFVIFVAQEFQALKAKYGSQTAFHGSTIENWHCIVNTGLRNFSGTDKQKTGALFGEVCCSLACRSLLHCGTPVVTGLYCGFGDLNNYQKKMVPAAAATGVLQNVLRATEFSALLLIL